MPHEVSTASDRVKAAPPPDTVALANQLRALAACLDHYAIRLEHVDDSRCVFARCYAMLTDRLANAIEADETWRDPTWVVELAAGFAALYIDAIDEYDARGTRKTAWNHLQQEIREKRSSVLQDLVLGLVGHIVHDLPLALEELWRAGGDAGVAVDDFHRVNDVLGAAIKPVRAQLEHLYNPYLRWLDWLLPGMLEQLTDEGLRLSRAAAWYNALRLVNGRQPAGVRAGLEALPIAFTDQLFAPPGRVARLVVRTLNTLVSFGRRWPRVPVPDLRPLPESKPNQAYYFGTGVGHWRGRFQFAITDWAAFRAADSSVPDCGAALLTALVQRLLGQASLESWLDGYPDQGPLGVATSHIRVSVLGIPMYTLREQYALDADGERVHVRGYERIGPFSIGGINAKSHAGRVEPGGRRAHYTIPMYGVDWSADYEVSADRNRVDSVMQCAWGKAFESLERVTS